MVLVNKAVCISFCFLPLRESSFLKYSIRAFAATPTRISPIPLVHTDNTTMSSYHRGGGRGGRQYHGRGRGGGGGGGRGRGGRGGQGRGGGRGPGQGYQEQDHVAAGGGSYQDLLRTLQQIDGKSYGAYHELDTPMHRGWTHQEQGFALFVERAQSDSFAPPTRCRIVLSASHAGFPPLLWTHPVRRLALSDYILRAFYAQCKRMGADGALAGNGWSGPKGGDIQILEPCQHVLEQSAIRVDDQGNVVAQLTVNLPARGRTILGSAAEQIFGDVLPTMIREGLTYASMNAIRLKSHIESIEDQYWVQEQLEQRNLVAFIPNGAILPRQSGVDDRPMPASVNLIPFQSPARLQVSFTLPNAHTTITGMGIPKGISLICGGGFHGKSTLLQALQCGIYPKIPGDGREFCVTAPNATKIRSEDGRQVHSVDISSFINRLPFGKDTTRFSTTDASGSTSQASNIVEAVEVGANVLLIDEDTCATNFMIRDDKMMQLVAADKEPITPFVRLIRSMYDDQGISTILVVGGTGDYLDVADNVLVMDSYLCQDATERAKQIVANSISVTNVPHQASAPATFQVVKPRAVIGRALAPNGKVKVTSQGSVAYGETQLDLDCLEQLVSKSQTAAIAQALKRIPQLADGKSSLVELLQRIDQELDEKGLDFLAPGQCHGGMSRPRLFEIAAAVNRLRHENIITQL
eukprot:Nitzschia sp. Nitz4//scaffold4_size323378//44595//46966//NITZ4_000623-RA/size323378-snap-gene-0.440-mRNA-1//-1//CDS//3329553288//1376//frame0